MRVHGQVTDQTAALAEAMEVLALAFPRKTGEELLTQQGKLFARDVTRITPPRTKSQGQKRVGLDIGKAVKVVRPSQWRDKRVLKAIRRKNASEFLELVGHMSRNGAFKVGLAGLKFLRHEAATPEAIKRAHQSQRDRRGRVRRGFTSKFFTFNVTAYNAYVKAIKQHVGFAKGGWSGGWLALGGKPPAWIAAHKAMGTFHDGRKKPGLNMFFEFVNRAPWATDKNAERVRDAALKDRQRNMLAQAEHVIKAQFKKLESQLRRAHARAV